MKEIVVIYHRADFDGLFCREIARKFLPDAELIGWDFADKPLDRGLLNTRKVYVLDLPFLGVFGLKWNRDGQMTGWLADKETGVEIQPVDRWDSSNCIWIDHHKSSIEDHPPQIRGYCIDGVAACRLAWQWFNRAENPAVDVQLIGLPEKQAYIERTVSEPYAVQLAGEYDIWDKRNPDAEVFQFALRSTDLGAYHWDNLLCNGLEETCDGSRVTHSEAMVAALLKDGRLLQRYQQEQDASLVKAKGHVVTFEGLRFLALNTGRCNSLTFAARDVPETGHEALMGYGWDGTRWTVSLYHARHRTELDLSVIAVKHGGGGHRGACGFKLHELPFAGGVDSPTWPHVLQFARRMEKQLTANRHKGNREAWLKDHPWNLVERMLDETVEVQQCFKQQGWHVTFGSAEQVADECADVANFALMVADTCTHHAT